MLCTLDAEHPEASAPLSFPNGGNHEVARLREREDEDHRTNRLLISSKGTKANSRIDESSF